MTIIRVKGFKIFRDRHGHWRCYHRKTGIPIDLRKAPIGSAQFIAECARIAVIADEKAAEKEKRGTLGLLICDYRKWPIFQGLAHRTRADYQKVFDYLRSIADAPLIRFDRPLVVRIRDKAAASKGRRFGNYAKAVLSINFGWGRERGFIADNPASGPKDALGLPRNFAKGGEIATRRTKTGEPVFWPMPAPLADILDNAPHHMATTLCANSRGTPWTPERLQFRMG